MGKLYLGDMLLGSVAIPKVVKSNVIASYIVDENGVAQKPEKVDITNAFDDITEIGEECFYNFFYTKEVSGTISFPKLVTVRDWGLAWAFCSAYGFSGELNFPKLKTIDDYGMDSAFSTGGELEVSSVVGNLNFPSLEIIGEEGLAFAFYQSELNGYVSFPKLKTVKKYGLANAFSESSKITGPVNFDGLETLYDESMRDLFNGCSNLEGVINFPNLRTIEFGVEGQVFENAFRGTKITEIHFRKDVKVVFSLDSDIEYDFNSLAGYGSKFGATNATIYFDL